MEINFEEIILAKKGQIYLITGRERDIDILKRLQSTIADKTLSLIRVIRGQRCSNKEELFQEFAATLQFPYYFGNNWDAFDECINDLSWLPADRYIFFITNLNKVLSRNPKDLVLFLYYLNEAVIDWNQDNEFRKNKPFHLIFHCENEFAEICKKILQRENITFLERELKPFDNIK